MSITKLTLALGTGIACTLLSPLASANIVYNGGFEMTSQSSYNFVVNDGGTVTGWSLASDPYANVDDCIVLAANASNPNHMCGTTGQQTNPIYNMYAVPGASPAGGNYFLMDGYQTPQTQTEIYQTLTTVVGQEYQLTFYQASGDFIVTNPCCNSGQATTEDWEVFFGNQMQNSPVMNTPAQSADGWEQVTMTFVANSTSTVLGFLANGTPVADPPTAFLDGVDVEAVPEPSTMALMGIGLLGVPFASRYLRKRKA